MTNAIQPANASSGDRVECGAAAPGGAVASWGSGRGGAAALDRERVLVWAPRGRDAARIIGWLRRHRIAAEACSSASELAAALGSAGCAVVAQEAVDRDGLNAIQGQLERQQPWSDFRSSCSVARRRGVARRAARGRPSAT